VVAADAVEGRGMRWAQSRVSSLACFLYCSRLGAVGDFPVRHTKLLSVSRKSGCASGVPHVVRLKEIRPDCEQLRWARPFPRTGMRPSRFPEDKGCRRGKSREAGRQSLEFRDWSLAGNGDGFRNLRGSKRGWKACSTSCGAGSRFFIRRNLE